MVDVLVDPTMDPVLSARLTNFANKLKTDDAFASFYSWIGNANSKGKDIYSKGKDIWITGDQPAGGYSLSAAWYDDARTITPYGDGRYDWQSATGYATQAEARGISVVFLGHWATTPVNGWPAYNTSVGTADGVGEASVERMVFHELAHGVTKADNFLETLSDGFAGNYNEEIAAAIENVFYAPYAHKNGLSDDFMESIIGSVGGDAGGGGGGGGAGGAGGADGASAERVSLEDPRPKGFHDLDDAEVADEKGSTPGDPPPLRVAGAASLLGASWRFAEHPARIIGISDPAMRRRPVRVLREARAASAGIVGSPCPQGDSTPHPPLWRGCRNLSGLLEFTPFDRSSGVGAVVVRLHGRGEGQHAEHDQRADGQEDRGAAHAERTG